MAADTKVKKRKSLEAAEPTSKKVKVAKSADRPAPLKSALKKDKIEPTIAAPAQEPKKATPKKAEGRSKPSAKSASKSVEAAAFHIEPEIEVEGYTELTPDQTAALLAGFSDSEDEDEDDGIPISQLPKAPAASSIQKGISEALASITAEHGNENPETTPGVIYVGRIPHGFYEPQMRAYFGQFGDITHLRLARNKKTGRSRHYAFIEFASSAVADIVTKTMDKYLLFGHILQARRVPKEQVKESIWKGEKRKRAMPRNRIEGTRLRKGTDREGWEKRIAREEERRKNKAEQLKELGYEFDMPKIKRVNEVPEKAEAETLENEKAAETQLLEDVQRAAEPETKALPASSDTNSDKLAATTTTRNGKSKKKSKAIA